MLTEKIQQIYNYPKLRTLIFCLPKILKSGIRFVKLTLKTDSFIFVVTLDQKLIVTNRKLAFFLTQIDRFVYLSVVHVLY